MSSNMMQETQTENQIESRPHSERRLPDLTGSKINRSGLLVGTVAPDFDLRSLAGDRLSLGLFRGRRLLLVFSDPACGPCNELLPKLGRLHLRTPDIAVLMISRGDAGANSKKVDEHHLTFSVALQRGWEISRLYGLFATPCAYLIDAKGTIAAPPAVGSIAILNLLTGAAILSLLQDGAELSI
jgi:peroxiredoxin